MIYQELMIIYFGTAEIEFVQRFKFGLLSELQADLQKSKLLCV